MQHHAAYSCADCDDGRRRHHDTILHHDVAQSVEGKCVQQLVGAKAHGQPREGIEALELQSRSPCEADVPAQLQADALQFVEAAIVAMPLQPPRIGMLGPFYGGRLCGAVDCRRHGPRLRRHDGAGVRVPLPVTWSSGALWHRSGCWLVPCCQAWSKRHPQHVLRPQGLERARICSRALEVVPIGYRQPDELREHPHGGALGNDAGMHRQPHRH
mmetsp:Transcript_119169/g.344716  ORF Transcript_119169/g.344716 Transcript_119169/m.344716 type:complete len:214 (-) Transcript_119169:377-1018(-)